MKKVLFFASFFLLTGCLHTVTLNNFPTQKEQIDYDEIKRTQPERNSNLIYGSKQEFYFQDSYTGTEESLIFTIKQVIQNERFTLIKSDTDQDYTIFEKGLSAEAWKSMVGVYYDIDNESNSVQLYFLYQMSQDVTGSFKYNFAELIGLKVQEALHNTKT